MLELLSSFIIHYIQSAGYVGVFVLMMLESALIPIPSEVTMPFAGFLAQTGKLSLFWIIFAGALGNLVGSLVAYGIGFYLEETVVLLFIKKYGKFLLITEHEYIRSVSWFKKYGNGIAFFSRLLPAVRTFISLPAGLSEMNVWKFSIYTFLGSLIWSGLLAYIGFYLGENWHILEGYFRKFEYLIVFVILFGVVWYVNHKLQIISFKKKSTSQ